MEWIDYIAFNRNIRGEEPNKELAKQLVDSNSISGIREISEYIYDKNKSISSDCIAVLYNVGYLEPTLISSYVNLFIDLLGSKINRLVWGGMIALSTITNIKSELIFSKIDYLLDVIEKGTLITQIHGINVLIKLCLEDVNYKFKLMPMLFDYLNMCRPVDLGKRVELMLPVLESEEESLKFETILNKKVSSLSDSQVKKLRTIINRHNKKLDTIKINISI
ncbi:MAG: hypothetical protein OCD02_13250 [Spirochaetaceae bacterium]